MSKPVKFALAALILVVLGCCAALFFMPRGEGATAVVTLNGEVVREIDLSDLSEPVIFTVTGENGLSNAVAAENGRICVQSANCPDQICVRQGWISDSTLPIVCLPNQLIIQIKGEEGQFDAATG